MPQLSEHWKRTTMIDTQLELTAVFWKVSGRLLAHTIQR
jgi:hypothetical protein